MSAITKIRFQNRIHWLTILAMTFITFSILVVALLPQSVNPAYASPAQQTITYTPDNSTNFPNPERGFYWANGPFTNDTLWLTDPWVRAHIEGNTTTPSLRQQGISMVRQVYSLSLYRAGSTVQNGILVKTTDQPIPQWYLDKMTKDFAYARKQGLKVIVKFVYTWNIAYTGPEDGSLAVFTTHAAQLKPILKANADVIAWMEEGFVGYFGEWHDSTNGHMPTLTLNLTPSGKKIFNAMFDLLPANRMWAARYVQQISQVLGKSPITAAAAYKGTPLARVGYSNTGWRYDVTDFGSWSEDPVNRANAQAYAQSQMAWTLTTGEPAGTSSDDPTYGLDGAGALADILTFHWSGCAVNQSDALADGVYTAWKNSGHYDQIARRLGYRVRLNSATLPTTLNAGDTFSMSMSLTNDGAARLVNPRLVEIILRNQATGAKHVMNITPGLDVRAWLPGSAETKTLTLTSTLSTNLPAGVYDILLNFPDPFASLHNQPAYSLRLANTAIWEASSGYNKLNASLTIANNNTRTIINNERGFYYGYPYDPSGTDPFSSTTWADIGAFVGLRHVDQMTQMQPAAIKAVHGRTNNFFAGDDTGYAYFPYSALKQFEAAEIAAGRDPIFVTATYQGKQRPVVFIRQMPTDTGWKWMETVNVRDPRFIQFFYQDYLMNTIKIPGLSNQWYSFDECGFFYEDFGVVDDNGVFIPNVTWDAPFPQNDDEWVDATTTLLSSLKTMDPTLKFLCNGPNASTPQKRTAVAQQLDGLLVEDFLGEYQATQPWGADNLADRFADVRGDYLTKLQFYQPRPSSASAVDEIRSFYCAYAIFSGPNSFFGPLDPTSTETNPAYWQTIKLALGAPVSAPSFTVDAAAENYGARVYRRTFEHGIAFLNWTGKSQTITLPTNKAFVDKNGNPIKQLQLAYREGGYVLLAPTISLTLNSGFEIYTGTSKIPTDWAASKNFSPLDGKNTLRKFGAYSVKLNGAGTAVKTLTQTKNINGVAGDLFILSYWVAGSSLPSAGKCMGQVFLYNGTTLKAIKTLPCPSGTYTFTQKKIILSAPTAYTRAVIKFTFSKTRGSVWLDAVSLMR